jgi:transposase-like protein
MEIPATVLGLCERFPDEEACWSYVKETRWPSGFVCPRCASRSASYLETRKLWQCRSCRHQVSVTAGTVFHGSRVALRKWFVAIFFLARHKQGISALQLQRDLGLGSYQTAWTMLHKLRSALGRRPGQLLKGLVEADEAFLGGPRSGGKRGRGAPNKTMLAVLVERREKSAGAAHIDVVPDGSFASLGPVIRGAIEAAATTVITDRHSGYAALGDQGVHHEAHVVNTPERADAILPWVHVVISNLKAWLHGTFRGVSPKHLRRYLLEFTYRLNRRGIADRLFFFLLRRAVEGRPLPYHRLKAEAAG